MIGQIDHALCGDVEDGLLVKNEGALRAAQVEVKIAAWPEVERDDNQRPTGCERGILRRRGALGGYNFAEGIKSGVLATVAASWFPSLLNNLSAPLLTLTCRALQSNRSGCRRLVGE